MYFRTRLVCRIRQAAECRKGSERKVKEQKTHRLPTGRQQQQGYTSYWRGSKTSESNALGSSRQVHPRIPESSVSYEKSIIDLNTPAVLRGLCFSCHETHQTCFSVFCRRWRSAGIDFADSQIFLLQLWRSNNSVFRKGHLNQWLSENFFLSWLF